MLRKNAKIELLKRVPLFERCSQRELAQIAALADELDLPAARNLTQRRRGRLRSSSSSSRARPTSSARGASSTSSAPATSSARSRSSAGRPRTATVKTRGPARHPRPHRLRLPDADARRPVDPGQGARGGHRAAPGRVAASSGAGRAARATCARYVGAASSSTSRLPGVSPCPSSLKVWPTSPPSTTGPSSVSTTTIWCPRVSPGAGTIRTPGRISASPVVLDVVRAGEVDPLADRVVVLRPRVLELDPLHVDRDARKEPVGAVMVEVHVRDDHVRDALDELVRQRVHGRMKVLVELGRRLDHPGVDEDEPVRMLDRVREAGPGGAVDHELARQVDADIVTLEHGLSIWRPRPKMDRGSLPVLRRGRRPRAEVRRRRRAAGSRRRRARARDRRCRRTSARPSSTASRASCASGTRTWRRRSAPRPASRSRPRASRRRGRSRPTPSPRSKPASSPATSSRWTRRRPARARSRSRCAGRSGSSARSRPSTSRATSSRTSSPRRSPPAARSCSSRRARPRSRRCSSPSSSRKPGSRPAGSPSSSARPARSATCSSRTSASG